MRILAEHLHLVEGFDSFRRIDPAEHGVAMGISRSKKALLFVTAQSPIPAGAATWLPNVGYGIECQADPPFLNRDPKQMPEHCQLETHGVVRFAGRESFIAILGDSSALTAAIEYFPKNASRCFAEKLSLRWVVGFFVADTSSM